MSGIPNFINASEARRLTEKSDAEHQRLVAITFDRIRLACIDAKREYTFDIPEFHARNADVTVTLTKVERILLNAGYTVCWVPSAKAHETYCLQVRW